MSVTKRQVCAPLNSLVIVLLQIVSMQKQKKRERLQYPGSGTGSIDYGIFSELDGNVLAEVQERASRCVGNYIQLIYFYF